MPEDIKAPLTGTVWKIETKVGDALDEDDVIMILESMKMEIEIYAPQSGKVVAIARKEGQQINAGQAIMVLD